MRASKTTDSQAPPEERTAVLPTAEHDGKPTTGKELLEALVKSGFIGAWKDRTDIGDSVEFAQRLRRRAEHRTSD